METKYNVPWRRWKTSKITMEDAVTIIALNNLGPGFESYLAIVNDKARHLGRLIKALQEEKARLQHAESWELGGAVVKDEEEVIATEVVVQVEEAEEVRRGQNHSGGSNINSTPRYHLSCGTSHPSGQCPDAEFICGNKDCKRNCHKTKNCTWHSGAKHEEYMKKKEEREKNKGTNHGRCLFFEGVWRSLLLRRWILCFRGLLWTCFEGCCMLNRVFNSRKSRSQN